MNYISDKFKPENIMVMLRPKSQVLSYSSIPSDRSADE